MSVLNWFIDNLFTQTSVIIGLITVVGLIASKKSISEIIQGFIKTLVGYSIFGLGIGCFVGVMNYFQEMLAVVFNVPAVTLSTEFTNSYGYLYGPVIVSGFLFHLLLERFVVPQKYRFVYMGGGHFLLREAMLTTGIAAIVFGVKNAGVVILFGTILSGIHYSFQPAYVHRFTKELRGDDLCGYGHQSSIAVFVTCLLAKKLGKAEKSTEEVVFPKGVSFLRDMSCAITIVQVILLVGIGLLCGGETVQKIAGISTDPYVWLVLQAITFAGGFMAFTYGLRTMMSELIPSFSGIADKIIPGARPALDVPTVFPFGSNAVIFGSTISIAVFLLWMVLFNILGWGAVFPMIPSLFMSGAGAAVFGNKFGGIKGACIGGVVVATMIAFGMLFATSVGSSLTSIEYMVGLGAEPDDFMLLWPLYYLLGKLFFGRG